MSKVTSLCLNRAVRIGLLAVATALVIVPTVARANQHVERRDSTRLSIRHSWIGVAPPTKAFVAPVEAAVLPPPVVEVDHNRAVSFVSVAWSVAPCALCDNVSDPLRGPPSYLS
jgi:hypothetical protein